MRPDPLPMSPPNQRGSLVVRQKAVQWYLRSGHFQHPSEKPKQVRHQHNSVCHFTGIPYELSQNLNQQPHVPQSCNPALERLLSFSASTESDFYVSPWAPGCGVFALQNPQKVLYKCAPLQEHGFGPMLIELPCWIWIGGAVGS